MQRSLTFVVIPEGESASLPLADPEGEPGTQYDGGVRRLCFTLSRALLLLGACASASSAQKDAAAAGDGWPTYGGTDAGQHYSTAKQITPRNVAILTPAWVFHTHTFDQPAAATTGRASFEATPVLWNDTLYFDTPYDQIFAVDAATGELRWSFDPHVDRAKYTHIVTSRGVALWHATGPHTAKSHPGPCGQDAVLLATLDRRLIARDAATGVACPHFGENGTVDLTGGVAFADRENLSYTSPATIVGNTIILGSSIADNRAVFTASGAVRGFDAVTGRQKWSWEPIRDTAAVQAHRTGSANAWAPLAADPAHDLVFVPTGSASVDFFGGTRPGDDRDADSLVALRASTGERVWAFQLVHHDLWDYDTPAQPVLFTFLGGRSRSPVPAVAIVTKTSMVFVFNRLTGEPLFPVYERPVAQSTLPGEHTSPTQPFSSLPSLTPLHLTAADFHLNSPADQQFCLKRLAQLDNFGIFTPPSQRGVVVYPGDLGGANWGSASLDPATNILYTRVSSLPYVVQEIRRYPSTSLENRLRQALLDLPTWLGGTRPLLQSEYLAPDSGGRQAQLEGSDQDGAPYWLSRSAFMTRDGAPCAPQPFGAVVALNLNTGRKLWTAPHGRMPGGEAGTVGAGGVVATAGGLLFVASANDSLLRAYSSATGTELWHAPLPAPANATPMTYTAGGRQYVVVAAGGHGFIGKGRSDAVIAFALPARR